MTEQRGQMGSKIREVSHRMPFIVVRINVKVFSVQCNGAYQLTLYKFHLDSTWLQASRVEKSSTAAR